MSQNQPKYYRVDIGADVDRQVRDIEAHVVQSGKAAQFREVFQRAVHLLRTDPHGWGDPEYRAKTVNGVMYHATIRPIAFRYAVYEDVQGVVLLKVSKFAEFD